MFLHDATVIKIELIATLGNGTMFDPEEVSRKNPKHHARKLRDKGVAFFKYRETLETKDGNIHTYNGADHFIVEQLLEGSDVPQDHAEHGCHKVVRAANRLFCVARVPTVLINVPSVAA